jgi:phosphate starvation-inducible protein PhoH and related proteins
LGKRASRKTVRAAKVQSLFPSGHDDPYRAPWQDHSHYTRNIRPKSPRQQEFIDALDESSAVIALGPAGTGKTFIAIAKAVEALDAGNIRRIVLCRPAVEAGENLGYLPGDICAKLAPYLRPIYDALSDRVGGRRLKQLLADDTIEIAPVAFMRGRTLTNAFILVDEAQNCTYGQLKLLLTRLGPGSTLVIAGDPDQSDLLPGMSGLGEIANRLEPLDGIAVIRMTAEDVVRHPLVAEMLSVL